MQSNTSTRKWSDIRGLAVVAINTGKKLGTVEDFYFDPQTSAVRALLVKTGLFGHRAILSSSINAVGLDAVTVADEASLIEERDDDRLPTMPLGQVLLKYRILSEAGIVIGTVGNVLLDTTPSTMHIDYFELTGGLRERITGHYPIVPAKSVVRYGQDVIVIANETAQALPKD